MANIINYKKSNSYTSRSITPVNVHCIYETQNLNDGSRVLVIKTYNPDSIKGGISQTIHFTKQSAMQLMDIFKKELNI